MRRFSLLLLFTLMLLPGTLAQSAAQVQCLDETTFSAQASIQLPEISADAPSEYRITTLRSDDLAPLVAVTNAEGDTFCNGGSDSATLYEFSSSEISFTPSVLAAQEFAFDPGQNSVQIGAENDAPGSYLVIIEGAFYPEDLRDHTYTIDIAASEDSTLPARALLFALDDESAPSLQLVNAAGESQEGQPTEAQLTTDIEISERAISGEIDQQAQITIPYDEFGRYALALIFSTGNATEDSLAASVSESELGGLDLRCDETIFIENALEIVLPDDEQAYTVTALDANGESPVLAAVDAEGAGFCETSMDATYGATLPDLDIPASQSGAQLVANEARRIVAGNQENFGADMLLLVEGAVLDAEAETDTYQVRITPGMLDAGAELEVYAIALTTELDAVLSLDLQASALFGEETAIICDNAGEGESCYGQNTLLNDYSVTLSAEPLRGYELDASLRLPLFGLPDNTYLPITVSANEGSSGGYVLILHLVTQ
ncbi:MAG: hypothetical protein KC496_01725 [Anaerolineae bacterium]|nr:hypothetical protein [Anaerolineae bacterium]